MMSVKTQISQTIASSWLSLVIVSACQLIMIPIALGALSKVDFALFAVISQMLMAIMLAEVGVRSACARLLIDALAKDNKTYNKVWMASVCVFAIQALVMLVLIVCFAPFLSVIFNLNKDQESLGRSIFVVVGVLNTLNYAMSVFSTALLAGQRLSRINVITAIYATVQLAFFSVAIKMGAGLWAYPIALCGAIVSSQVMMISMALKYKLVGQFNWRLIKWDEIAVVFSLGFDIFVAAIFSMVMGNSLLLFSGHLLSLEQTAILAVNLKLVNMMTQVLQRVPGSASPLLMKMVSEGKDQQFRVWWKLVTKITLALTLICAGMFVIWNKIVVVLWTSEDMLLSGSAVILLALIPFRYLTHYQFVNSLTIFKEIRKVKWWLAWEIVLYVGMAWLMGSFFGLMGLLSANLISMLGGALFFGIRWFSSFSCIPFKELVMLFVRSTFPLAVAFTLVYTVALPWVRADMLGSLMMTLLWSIVIIGIAYVFILDKSERHQVSHIINALKLRLKST